MTEILKKYQELDGQIKRIIDEINRSEEAKASKKLGQFLKDAEENLKKMETRAKELSITYTKLHEKFSESTSSMDDLEGGVEHAIDAGELQYISKRLAEVNKNVSIVEREIIAVQKEMEEMLNRYDVLRSKVPSAQKQYAEARNAVNQMKREKEEEILALKKESAALENKIDAKVIEIYRRLRSQGLFPVYVPLSDGNKCGGCRMDIPSGTVGKLDTEKYIICENCGRIVAK